MNIQAYLESNIWKPTADGQWLQAPVTLIVEGVHRGSAGAIYHAAHVLKESFQKWASIPLTLGHPQVDGKFVSITQSPEVFSQYQIGEVVNPYWDEQKKAIRASVRIPASHPQKDRLMKLREVSVGVFTKDTETYGSWYGENYSACSISHAPDHLALLPEGQVGACNFSNDGCGIRVNSAGYKILQNALTTYVNNLIGGNKMNEDYEYNMATPQFQAVEGETGVDAVQILKEFEDFPGLVPQWVLALRAKQESKQSQDTYQGEELLLPFGVE